MNPVFWRGTIPQKVVLSAFQFAEQIRRQLNIEPPRPRKSEAQGGDCDECGERYSLHNPWWVEIDHRWIHLCIERCGTCGGLVYDAGHACRACALPPLYYLVNGERRS